jgi:hypothetical protein
MVDGVARGARWFQRGVTLCSISLGMIQLPGAAAQVVVESDAGKTETLYSISDGTCQIRWTVFESATNAGVIQHRATCGLPLGQQLSLTARLLEKVVAAEREGHNFRSMYLGRLDSLPGMSARLAILAKQSPRWDLRKGQPKSGNINAFVAQLANQGGLYQEWQEMFQRFDRHVEVSGVEKVAVSKAGDLPDFKQLQEQGIGAADKVPYDCQIWLAVTKRGPTSR